MGFSQTLVEEALDSSNGDENIALDNLLKNENAYSSNN